MKLVPKAVPERDVHDIPENKFRRFFYLLSKNKKFEIFILVIIIFNIVLMAMAYDQASTTYNSTIEAVNLVFT
jgi:hypothetical protein